MDLDDDATGAPPMRIALLNLFYRPDISPTAHLSASLAEYLAAQGHEVTVVTGRGGYTGSTAPDGRDEDGTAGEDGVGRPRVIRLWTPRLGKGSGWRRIADYASYYTRVLPTLIGLPRQDAIVSLTTPPFIGLVAAAYRLLHPTTKTVLWNMDSYPEALERLGFLRLGSLPSRGMAGLARVMMNRMDRIVTLDSAMTDMLRDRYIAPNRSRPGFRIIPNFEDAAMFPWPIDREALRAGWPAGEGLRAGGYKVLLYLGNTGHGHAFDAVLAAAERAQAEGVRVRIVFVGGGARMESIRQRKESRGLANVELFGYVPKAMTPAVMATADAALITMRDESAGVMSPSKLHSNLATGLPVLYVGPAGTNVDDAITRFGCGERVATTDADGVLAFMRRLEREADTPAWADLRATARSAFEQRYCDTVALPEFDELLRATVAGR